MLEPICGMMILMNDKDQSNAVLVLDRADRDRTALKSAFRAAGIRYLGVDDLGPGVLADQLLDAIRTVRLVLVVIDNDPVPPSVLLEIGYAYGVGKRIAVLDGRDRARHGNDELALDTLLRAPRLYARLDDVAGLTEQLQAYLESEQHYVPREYLEEFTQTSSIARTPVVNIAGSQVERRTADALLKAGATFVQDRPRTGNFVPDLAVQFPYLEKPMNPVLVEVKGLRADLEGAHEQLVSAMTAGNVHLGIIVTLDDLEPTQYQTRGRVITQMSLSELEKHPDHLRRFLTIARNLAVHGG
jgi:hypothetical protein